MYGLTVDYSEGLRLYLAACLWFGTVGMVWVCTVPIQGRYAIPWVAAHPVRCSVAIIVITIGLAGTGLLLGPHPIPGRIP